MSRTTSIWSEPDGGWWAILAPGWCAGDNPGQHGLHESTKANLMRSIREAATCRCSECAEATTQHKGE